MLIHPWTKYFCFQISIVQNFELYKIHFKTRFQNGFAQSLTQSFIIQNFPSKFLIRRTSQVLFLRCSSTTMGPVFIMSEGTLFRPEMVHCILLSHFVNVYRSASFQKIGQLCLILTVSFHSL